VEKTQEYLVKTNRKPCSVNVILTTDGSKTPIYIIGYDPWNVNTLYFRSRFLIAGSEEVTLNCPQSPIFLKIIIWSEDNLPYQLASIKVNGLARSKEQDPIIVFVEQFARQVGRLRPGIHSEKNVPFKIELKRKIYKDNGEEHATPARIHTEQPIIQVSKAKFNNMTIPERIIILLHEVAHNFISYDQDDEVEADQHAIQLYNELGYPKIEAVNAFGEIFSDTDTNYERMLNLINM
jgi:hypothetical protein